jgi:ribonuclease HI
MEEVWSLPDLDVVTCTDPEWLLHMLDNKSEVERTMILLTLWRIWYARNEVVHHKPMPSIESSRRFLCSYLDSLLIIKHDPGADPMKGKSVVSFDRMVGEKCRKKKDAACVQPLKPWIMPRRGSIKLNVDGSFCATDGTGGTCMVLRDETGMIIVSACSFMSSCSSPLHAELKSCREGIAMAMEWSTLPCLIEMDCTEAVKMIKEPGIDRSLFMSIVQEIKELLVEGDRFDIVVISHEQNKASHVLANLGRSMTLNRYWPNSGPDEVLAVCQAECNPVI